MRPDVHNQEDDAPHDQFLAAERLNSRIEASPPYFFQRYSPEDCGDHRQYDSRDLLHGQSQQREKHGDTNQPRRHKPHSAPTFQEINDHYRLPVNETIKTHTYARTTADITRLLRQIIEAGFTVSTTYNGPLSVPGFTFVVNELLAPPSADAEKLFAQFLAELNHFADLGAKTYTEMQMTGRLLTITYFIPVASFSVIKNQIDDLLKYLKTEENDFTRDTFEMMFEDGLKTNYNYIADEIQLYSND